MKIRNHIKRKINIGYIKPTKKEIAFLRKAEGFWTVKLVHLGLYGEEIETRACSTWNELREKMRRLRYGFVIRYV